MAEEDKEWEKLAPEDQVKNPLWRARLNGYQELTKKFGMMDAGDKEFSKYLGLLKGFVTDSNAVAQEKGLETALCFVENAKIAGKTAGEVCPSIIQKCLGAPKAKTKEKGQELLMMYIEVEKPDVVCEELLTGFSHKTPKIRAASIQTMCMAVNQFGAKPLTLKPVVKLFSALMEDKDKSVREETKALAVELNKWIGPALKPQLVNLKPVQLTELEGEFAKNPGPPPAPTRWLRSQKPTESDQAAGGDGGEGTSGEGGDGDDGEGAPSAAAIDPWDYKDPIDALGKLQKDCPNFADDIQAKKWLERKQALDVLFGIVNDQRLDPAGNYGELVGILKNLVAKDSNINCVSVSAKCLAAIAAGLRKKFAGYAGMCVPVILEKFKEKKPLVRDACRDAIDAVGKSVTLESMMEDLVKALENKNPQIKQETTLYMARVFAHTTVTGLPKKILKIFSAALVVCANDQDGGVRDAAMEALGVAMKVVTEKNIAPFLTEVDAQKMVKIKEFCENAVTTAASAKPAVAAPAAAKQGSAAGAGGKPKTAGAAAKGPSGKVSFTRI